MENSLTQYQRQFGRNICLAISILLILLGIATIPIGLPFAGLGIAIIYFVMRYKPKSL